MNDVELAQMNEPVWIFMSDGFIGSGRTAQEAVDAHIAASQGHLTYPRHQPGVFFGARCRCGWQGPNRIGYGDGRVAAVADDRRAHEREIVHTLVEGDTDA